jgi:hypothetical protein
MREDIKEHLPVGLLNAGRATRDWINRVPEDFTACTHPWRSDSCRKLQKYHNRYQGKRCFVIGNGPSLKNTDLTKLSNEYTFGMNRIYLMFPELGFPTSFLVCVNDLVIEQTVDDMQNLEIPRFFSWRSRKWLKPADDLHFLHTTYTGTKFAKNAAGRLWEGATVTYVCLQLAYYFGFSEVILIGVDHSFVTQGKPNTTVVSQGDDPNHFHPGYFGKGFRWQLPDLETSELAYRMAKQAFEEDGRRIMDATVEGKLTVFPKVTYDDLF